MTERMLCTGRICLGRWNELPSDKMIGDLTDAEAEAQARKDAKKFPRDRCLGVWPLAQFQEEYNEDTRGDFSLDPSFYWMRFTGG